jgi:hypothetical protein
VRADTGRRGRAMPSVTGALAACALVVCLAAGCTVARSNLGTTESSCYLALPAATKAVGSHTRLLGVRLFTLADLRRQAPKLLTKISAERSPGQSVCTFAFSGHFTSTSVSEPHGRPEGPVAVVVLTKPSNRLLGTVIFKRLPLRYGHSHIG